MNRKPIILISNDDGIQAKGINILIESARKYGNVVVVAPDGPRSAQSSALTINVPVSVTKIHSEEGLIKYTISGTPSDCVKLAIDKLLPEKPDLVLSGINHGTNASVNVIYSGTMGATMEGTLHGVSSIGLSLSDHAADADFSNCLPHFEKMIEKTLSTPLPKGICLNVNAPIGKIKGSKLCVQAEGRWANEYEEHKAPRYERFFWLVGNFNFIDKNIINPNHITDQQALDQQFISIVPIHIDMTAHHVLSQLTNYED